MTIEEIKQALEAAVAARDLAQAAYWAVWEAIGGKAADEQVSICQAHPAMASEYVTEGTYGLPRWQKEKIYRERESVRARARARLDAALEAKYSLYAHPEWVKAEATYKIFADAVSAASAKWFEANAKPQTADDKAKALNSFRWNGKDADGDWADD